ncbi:MAG: endopeptidase La, partial [Candidatus Eisenbacteria sp.]|nr:endopeptidase La [Candidatus Eisenbacteria bacterium]
PARSRIAMTGEITLRGHVLPVGGLGEKLVAARRAGIHSIILPRGNAKHIEELPRELLEGLTLQGVETMDEVLSLGLESRLDERPQAGESSGATPLAA